MELYIGVALIIILLGAINLVYQMFKMVELDAICRGLKRPKLWALLATGGQNSSGLVLYMITRRKYPTNATLSQQKELDSRKNKAIVCILFTLIGAIGLFYVLVFKTNSF